MENEITNSEDLYLYIIRFDGLEKYTNYFLYHIADIKQNGKYKRKPTDDDYRCVITSSRTGLDGELLYQGEAHIPAATEEAALKWLDSYIKKSL